MLDERDGDRVTGWTAIDSTNYRDFPIADFSSISATFDAYVVDDFCCPAYFYKARGEADPHVYKIHMEHCVHKREFTVDIKWSPGDPVKVVIFNTCDLQCTFHCRGSCREPNDWADELGDVMARMLDNIVKYLEDRTTEGILE